jgi:hypothetical protein
MVLVTQYTTALVLGMSMVGLGFYSGVDSLTGVTGRKNLRMTECGLWLVAHLMSDYGPSSCMLAYLPEGT